MTGKRSSSSKGHRLAFTCRTKPARWAPCSPYLGFKNVVGKGAGPMVPLKEEEALSYEPDLIVFVSGMGGGDETKVLMEKEFAARPFYWNEFRAVKNGQLVYLPRRFAVSGGLEEVEQIKDLVSLLDAVSGSGQMKKRTGFVFFGASHRTWHSCRSCLGNWQHLYSAWTNPRRLL